MTEDNKAWEALGRYVVQNLTKRKGVIVSGLGTFTLTTQVNLEGINPALTKDRDDRQPVFIVSQELAPGIRSGIAHESGIRPYSNKGVSGGIPTVKLNYAELSQISSLSKDQSKSLLDSAIRKFSENVKKGDCRVDVPTLGSLVCKNKIVAVIFNKTLTPTLLPGTLTADGAKWLKDEMGIDLSNTNSPPRTANVNRNLQSRAVESRGKSPPNREFAESQIMSRHSSEIRFNMRNEDIEFPVSPDSPRSTLKMKTLSSNFLKLPAKEPANNIEFILENESKLRLIFSLKDPGARGMLSQEEFFEAIHMLENPKISDSSILSLISVTRCNSSNKIHYNIFLEALEKMRSTPKRPTSSVRSDYTGKYNRNSTIPLAKKIWEKRVEFTKYSQEGGMRPRVICSPSELLSILKKAAVSINIHQLKAVLRECGFLQASPLELIKGVRNLLAPESSDVSVFSDIVSQASSWAPVHDENMAIVKKYLKDFNIPEFFRRSSRKNGMLELDDFVEYITQESRGAIKGFEAEHAFRKASKGKFVISESEFCSAFQSQDTTKKTEKSAMEKIQNWLKSNRFSAAQGFNKLLESVYAFETLSKDNFLKAMKKLEISYKEAETFFHLLDTKNDGKLDLAEWKSKMYEEDNELNEMRDTVMSYGLDPNEILMKMDLRGRTKLTVEELCSALMKVDSSLTSKKAVEIARSLTGLNSDINVNELIEKISNKPDEGWINNLYEKVRNRGNFESVKKMFEDIDLRCMGKIEASFFVDCLNRAGFGLSIGEIDRLTRSLLRGKGNVDYLEFLEKIRPRVQSSDPFNGLISRLLTYFKQNSLTPEEFLRRQGGKIPLQKFEEFLSSKIQKGLGKGQSLQYAQRFDVNEDGWVDVTDLMTLLDKHQTIETVSLSTEKAGLLLADLRKILASKKMSYQDAFNYFDSERNGLISCKEFCEGLGRLTELSDPIKLSLFQYLDKRNVGLINFDTFAETLKYSEIKKPSTADSWDWENGVISRIRAWIQKENVTIEETFRAFDKDFDGVLSQEDLKKSLISVLKYPETEISVSKIERLYKLLDIYKRDSVQLSDFKTIFEEKRNPEWKDSAKQSLGLHVSKNYDSPQECFDEVSSNKDRITIDNFSTWLNKTRVLNSYRLTNQLVQELFAYLDPHKKGFISAQDWELCLGTFSYSSNCLQELKDAIRSNFSDVKVAFDYFLSFHSGPPPDKISLKDFEKALEAVIPKRFTKKETSSIWKQLFRDSSFISFREFKEHFELNKFMSSFAGSSKPGSARTITSIASSAKSGLSEDPLKRLQALIRASPYSIEDIFKEMDRDNSGTLSLIEFRNAMRKLNIGLSAKDIDGLLARIDTNNDGQIDWQEFQKQFKSSETETHIKASCQQRLNFLRTNMTHFMLSARDAFNQFDPERSGKMSFNSFTALVQRISELAREPAPSFPVIKDLFDIIDIRKDGVLDMREWLNTFKEAEKNSWEDSKQYEEICRLLAKNRKMLLDSFEQIGRGGKVEYEKSKEVINTVFNGIRLNEEQWKKIVGVACRDGLVDYRTMLDIYKQRCTSASQHPR